MQRRLYENRGVIRTDEQGRRILHRGGFSKPLVLTDAQAADLQPLLDDFHAWDKRWRPWILAMVLCFFVVGGVLSTGSLRQTSLPFAFRLLMLAVIGVAIFCFVRFNRSPLGRMLAELHKSAPHA